MQALGTPDDDEAMLAVARATAAEPLSHAPKLAAILRFLVAAMLRGEASRIKGYAIAVEVLGRPASFDPQADSTVRVAIRRLRDALAAYYSGAGAGDTLVITLPLGSYVPRFNRRSATQAEATQAEATGPQGGEAEDWRVDPVLQLLPLTIAGRPGEHAPDIGRLHRMLADAMALFDVLNIVTAPAGPGGARAPDYQLGLDVEHHGIDSISLGFRVIDTADGAIVWSRHFNRQAGWRDPGGIAERIVRSVATSVAEPFGVIWAHEYAARGGRRAGRASILVMIEYLRSFDPAMHENARATMRRLVAGNPESPIGHLGMALIHHRDHLMGIELEEGPALEQALRSVQRGIERRPQSAWAHDLLGVVHFARGDLGAAFAAIERARAMNPYDANIEANHGARLLASGQVARGRALLEAAAAHGTARPHWFEFYLFIAAWLDGDLALAAGHAAAITASASPYSLFARALLARANGDAAGAAEALERLAAIVPGRQLEPALLLARLFPAPAVHQPLLRDLGLAPATVSLVR